MKISEFNNMLLYSNRNIEKLARKLVNESANATLIEMFDENCYLADHTTGQVFESKYDFDGKVFEFKDFEEVKLEKSSDNGLREAILGFFNDKNVDLVESYKNSNNETEILESCLSEALASKNWDNRIDYTQLEGINEELGEFKDSKFFKLYEDRIAKHPMGSIKVFNWKTPVRVSLIDEDAAVVANKSVKEKAKNLKSDVEFKKNLIEAAKDYLESKDDEALKNLISENTELLGLDKAGVAELVGFSVLGSPALMENRKRISNRIEKIISEDDSLADRRAVLLEEDEGNEEDNKLEAGEEDVKALKDALTKAKGKIKDEKLLAKIDSLLGDLDEGADSGETDIATVKECIEMLML